MSNFETPIIDALKKYDQKKIISYDVPGHKKKKMNTEFEKLVGYKIHKYDLNSPTGLDCLINPNGVIKKSLEMASKIYKCDNLLYLINGSTSGIHIMIMTACKRNEKIILPRNIHKSVINALIFSGAIPIFINPKINKNFGIPEPISETQYINAMIENPDAKSIFIIYPTYYGSYINIELIIKIAHRMNMSVLVDQAHGAHFSFHPDLPISSSLIDADLIVLSSHKTTGSLTQTAILLHNGYIIDFNNLKNIYLMFCSTSPSYLLMGSLESSIQFLSKNSFNIYDSLIKECINLKIKLSKLPMISILGFDYENNINCE